MYTFVHHSECMERIFIFIGDFTSFPGLKLIDSTSKIDQRDMIMLQNTDAVFDNKTGSM